MPTNRFISTHFSLILICVAATCVTVLSTGCNNSGQTAQSVADSAVTLKPNNWVTLNIKFKPNTAEEQRDRSIKAIQRMLLHSVIPLMQQYSSYYPSMKVTTTPFTDTLQCWISIINTYGQGTSPMTYTLLKSGTPDPPTCPQCPTANPCRICDSLITRNYPGDPVYGISSISVDSTVVITK